VLFTLAIGLGASACSPDDEIAGPGPESGGPPSGLLESAIHLRIDVASGRVDVVEPEASLRAGRKDGPTPSFALLGSNEVGVSTSNFSRTSAGPARVRIRFDLRLTNRLTHSDLVTPTFPAPPAGITGVLLFPFKTTALDAAGRPLPLGDLRATPSVDWNGTGAAGSGAPHNFFNSTNCLPVVGDDCFRWESFGASIPAGATSAPRTVGFDADLLVAGVDVYVVLAADIRENALVGAIGGTVSSTLFGPLLNALVTVTPDGATDASDASGNYLVGGLVPGSKTVAVSGTPTSCFRPAPKTASVVAGSTADVDFPLSCRPIVYAQLLGAAEGYEIYRINANGTGETRLTNNAAVNVDPAWSPDGSMIAYSASGDITIMNADGSGQHAITTGLVQDIEPAWSWDGTRIAFSRFNAGVTDLWVINADGTGLAQLTTAAGDERDPSWSPDGTRIAFGRNGDIVVRTLAGGSETAITTNPFSDSNPAWSPDGSRIAYTANSEADDGEGSADHTYEIYTINPNGTGIQRVTNDDFFDLQPAWSPDGSLLVSSSYNPGSPRLFTVAATGGTPAPLTPPAEDGEAPGW
jgi:hypothetical protein